MLRMSFNFPRLACSFSAVVLLGCSAAYGNSVVTGWVDVELNAIRGNSLGPPMVARAAAIVHTCMYDSWAAYDSTADGTLYSDALRRPAEERTDANKTKAMSFAAYRALVDLFPQEANVTLFKNQMTSLGYDYNNDTTDTLTPEGIGNVVAASVLAYRHADGSNQLGDLATGKYADWVGYQAVNSPDQIVDLNHWQPLRVPTSSGSFNIQKFMAPQWSRVIPFALTSASQFRPEAPYAWPSVAFRQQVKEIVNTTARLDDTRKAISEYWSDGPNSETPPGHWLLLASYVSQRDSMSIDNDTKLFFALSNVLLDSSIACWDSKITYDSVRPITAVHEIYKNRKIPTWGGAGRKKARIKGKDWVPFQTSTFLTPPFPEHVSGHSTFSAASAEILKQFTGNDQFNYTAVVKSGGSRIQPGIVPAADITLTFDTFTAAADQACDSRLYGGIHFNKGNQDGKTLGRAIGTAVWQKAQNYFNGSAVPAALH